MGYDGKGQYPIKKIEEIDSLKIDFSKNYILEKLVKLKKEISVIITRFGINKYEIVEAKQFSWHYKSKKFIEVNFFEGMKI